MHYQLRGNVEYCVATGEVIILDVERARYLTLAPDCRDAFLRLLDSQGLVADSDLRELEVLRRRGYLVEGPSSEWTRKALDIAQEDFHTPQGQKPQPLFLIYAITSQWNIAARLRVSSLSTVIKYARRPGIRLSTRAKDSDRLIQFIVNGFEKSSLLLGRTDRCLIRSLAMFTMLQRRKVRSRLVFGVRADPFAAHCWVESGSAVLNDAAEHVSCFTPVMVVQ